MCEKIIAACGNDCAVCPRYNVPPYTKTAVFVHAFYKAIAAPVFFLAAGTGNLLVCHHVVTVADFIPQLGGVVQFFCGFGVRRHVVARTYRAVVAASVKTTRATS